MIQSDTRIVRVSLLLFCEQIENYTVNSVCCSCRTVGVVV